MENTVVVFTVMTRWTRKSRKKNR